MNKIISYTFFLSVLIVVSCEKDQFLGPPLESLYGELQVTRGERLIDSTNFSIFQVFRTPIILLMGVSTAIFINTGCPET